MKVLFFDDTQKVGEDELQEDLRTLPEWRRENVLSYRHLSDKVQCAKAFILLREALREEYGLAEVSDFEYGAFGKPHLKGHPEVHFNLSHCRSGAMCVIDDAPVGCDIECIPSAPDEDVMRAAFSEQERRCILTSPNPPLEYASLWTKKEALLKMTGRGLAEADLPNLLHSPDALTAEFIQGGNPSKGYAWTICKKLHPEF